jgi:hypothetical protein
MDTRGKTRGAESGSGVRVEEGHVGVSAEAVAGAALGGHVRGRAWQIVPAASLSRSVNNE